LFFNSRRIRGKLSQSSVGSIRSRKLRIEPLEDRRLLNAAPTDIQLLWSTVLEQQPPATPVGMFTSSDPDLVNSFTYSLASGEGATDNDAFTIDAMGDLLTASIFDFHAKPSYSIRVRSTDQGGLWCEKAFAVTVIPLAGRRVDLVSSSMIVSAAGDGTSSLPCASADGRYVAFESCCSTAVPGDTDWWWDIFVTDLRSGATTRVSTDSLGSQGDNHSHRPSISADGRYVAFQSAATNLVPGDRNGMDDIFVKDLQSGATTRVSTDSTAVEGNHISESASISGDGRYVTFASSASNLVSGDTNELSDIFVKDRATGSTTRISIGSSAVEGHGPSSVPAISNDGRYVAFQSEASNLVPGDTNVALDIFVHDRVGGVTTRVSTDSSGGQASGASFNPKISGDGRHVAIESDAANLVDGDTNGLRDIFVKDLVGGSTTRVSTDSSDAESDHHSFYANISGDGRYVAYQSFASNLVPGDTNGGPDVFVKDTVSAQTTRVSAGNGGLQGNGNANTSALSADGRYVVFDSGANNLVAGDTMGAIDIFVKDLTSGAISLVSRRSPEVSPVQATFGTFTDMGCIGHDGRYVAFSSNAANLVAGDTNSKIDVFVRDLLAGTTRRVSTSSEGVQGSDASWYASLSDDGRYVAFSSYADNLVANDTNGVPDIFIKDMLSGVIRRVSESSSAVAANNESTDPCISNDGRYVSFTSYASNLVTGDSNGVPDVFVKDMLSGATRRVSTNSYGTGGAPYGAWEAHIAGDGRYVAFCSSGNDLIYGDTNNRADIFVKDLVSEATTRVSTSTAGEQANDNCTSPAISDDGRYMAFESEADNLVPGDTNGEQDVFVKDLISGITRRISVDSESVQGNARSASPSINGDGRYVAFWSAAANLVPGDTNECADAFVTDMLSGITIRVSTSQSLIQGIRGSYQPEISSDGEYVTFVSQADGLHPWDTNGANDIYRVSNSLIVSDLPIVVGLAPADDSTALGVQADLVITFDRAVRKGAGSVVIKKSSDGSVVDTIDVASGSVTIVGVPDTTPQQEAEYRVLIDPGVTLAENTGYYVLVPAGAFEDLEGRPLPGINGSRSWSFATGDFTPPGIRGLSPQGDRNQIELDANLVIDFDEEVRTGTGKLLIKTASNGATVETIDVNSDRVRIVGTMVTIDLTIVLAEKTGYYVEVIGGAFQDLVGNVFSGISGATNWTFTTGDFTAPSAWINRGTGQTSLTSLSPIVFTITFSEPVSGFTTGDGVLSGSAGAAQARVYDRGDHTSFDVVVSGMIQSGTVVFTLPTGVASDAALNSNLACASGDNIVFYDYVGPETVGLFDPAASMFYLRNSNTGGPADYTFGYGAPAQNWKEVVGDWDGNGLDSVGLFDPATATWYLGNSLAAGYATWTFGFGDPDRTHGQEDANWMPLVGDWDGNGIDTVGLFDPATCTWYLRNSLSGGYADVTFSYGDPDLTHGHGDANWIPVVGDWNGDRGDSSGFFDPTNCVWHLRNVLSTGVADTMFAYGDASRSRGHGANNWRPIIGDWDGNRAAGIGFLEPATSTFVLRNSLTPGVADLTFGYGQPAAGWQPLAGCWSIVTAQTALDRGASISSLAIDQIDLEALVAEATEPTFIDASGVCSVD
jgi:hypothetical protein